MVCIIQPWKKKANPNFERPGRVMYEDQIVLVTTTIRFVEISYRIIVRETPLEQ